MAHRAERMAQRAERMAHGAESMEQRAWRRAHRAESMEQRAWRRAHRAERDGQRAWCSGRRRIQPFQSGTRRCPIGKDFRLRQVAPRLKMRNSGRPLLIFYNHFTGYAMPLALCTLLPAPCAMLFVLSLLKIFAISSIKQIHPK